MSTKMVIVVRKDLKMKPGKLGAQVGHAVDHLVSMVLEDREIEKGLNDRTKWSAYDTWRSTGGAKVVLAIHSEQELRDLFHRVSCTKIPYALIEDAGRTTFNGKPTITCLGIGPFYEVGIDLLTKHLKLY